MVTEVLVELFLYNPLIRGSVNTKRQATSMQSIRTDTIELQIDTYYVVSYVYLKNSWREFSLSVREMLCVLLALALTSSRTFLFLLVLMRQHFHSREQSDTFHPLDTNDNMYSMTWVMKANMHTHQFNGVHHIIGLQKDKKLYYYYLCFL